MNWYLTRIVFQIICGDGLHKPQFDEQLRLIDAKDEDSAFVKATALGNAEEDTFYNQKQQLVQWKFINISELYKLSLIDGAELNSKINEVDDEENYIQLVHAKAEQIQRKYSHQLLQLL